MRDHGRQHALDGLADWARRHPGTRTPTHANWFSDDRVESLIERILLQHASEADRDDGKRGAVRVSVFLA